MPIESHPNPVQCTRRLLRASTNRMPHNRTCPFSVSTTAECWKLRHTLPTQVHHEFQDLAVYEFAFGSEHSETTTCHACAMAMSAIERFVRSRLPRSFCTFATTTIEIIGYYHLRLGGSLVLDQAPGFVTQLLQAWSIMRLQQTQRVRHPPVARHHGVAFEYVPLAGSQQVVE